jgi:hypothetical protein
VAWSSPGTGAIDYSAEDDAAAAVEQFAGPNFRTQVRECTPARAVEMSTSLAPPSMKMRFRNAGFLSFGSICSTGAQDLDHLGVTSSDGEG